MKVLKDLSALHAPGATHTEPPVHHPVVGLDLGGGAVFCVRTGPAGIVLTDGQQEVAIPMQALRDLFAAHAPPP